MLNGTASWQVGGASAQGASHLRSGKPNQDALAWTPPRGEGVRIVAAVSDGHGASAHFRSGIGSRLAVEQATAILARHAEDDDIDDDALAAAILRGWRAAVQAHAAANPFTLEEGPGTPGSVLGPYGATLLTISADDNAMTILQIGDGDLMLGYPDGGLQRPLRADQGLVGEETFSLCQDDAETRFRVATLWRADGEPWPDFILLSSDGVSKSYRDDGAFEAAVAHLRDMARSDWSGLNSTLPTWLKDLSAGGSGDDCTLCVARRASS